MRRGYASLFLVLALTLAVAAAAAAGNLVTYSGVIKGFNEEKSQMIIAPQDADKSGLPKKLGIRLDEKAFKRAKNAYRENLNLVPPKKSFVTAECKDDNGPYLDGKMKIIAIGGC